MINAKLHATPVALDREQHKGLKLKPLLDWNVANKLNSMFVAAVEFGDVCREYPIVFVRAGQDDQGKQQTAPVAVFGLSNDENLYIQGTAWRAEYMPALLRMYPFGIARVDTERYALCVDTSSPALSQTEGQALFNEQGQPTEYLDGIHKQLQQIETEVQRTRHLCDLLQEKDLLRDMRFDADLPDGQKLSVDGFLTVDEKRLNDLSDADVLALHRNGVMGLIHAHQVSLPLMRRLVNWRLQRAAAQPSGRTNT